MAPALAARSGEIGGRFWLLVVVAVLVVTTVMIIAVRVATRRAARQWKALRSVVEDSGLELLPFNQGESDDENEREEPRVRKARHRILEFGREFRLFIAAADAVHANLQPIASGVMSGVRCALFHCRFRSGESRFSAFTFDRTVVGAEGRWELPPVVVLPRGARAAAAQVLDAVDYEFGNQTEQSFPKHDAAGLHYRLLAADDMAVRRLPRAFVAWLGRHPGLTLEAVPGKVILSRRNAPLSIAEARDLLDELRSLIEVLTAPDARSSP